LPSGALCSRTIVFAKFDCAKLKFGCGKLIAGNFSLPNQPAA
jgi:hypothetical protein